MSAILARLTLDSLEVHKFKKFLAHIFVYLVTS